MAAADHWIDTLHGAARRLAGMPGLGRERRFDNLELTGLRAWPAGNYVIFYLDLSDSLEVVRILHGARDRDALFER